MALNPDTVLVEEKPLYCPSMNDVAQALKDGLSENFETVEVSVVDCPDLTQKPFSLASQGTIVCNINSVRTVSKAGREGS
ncbi:hypothetical protein J6590_086525 [Homalodisca vitripennis]|nr:hypothetical protein J6590_086525 [Homalodisca vitripennis]